MKRWQCKSCNNECHFKMGLLDCKKENYLEIWTDGRAISEYLIMSLMEVTKLLIILTL